MKVKLSILLRWESWVYWGWVRDVLCVISAAAETGYEPPPPAAGCGGCRRSWTSSWLCRVTSRHTSWSGTPLSLLRRRRTPGRSPTQLSLSRSSGSHDGRGASAWTSPPHTWSLPWQGEGARQTMCTVRSAVLSVRRQKCRCILQT